MTRRTRLKPLLQLDKIVGMAMLVIATTVFSYYTLWTIFMVGLETPCTTADTDLRTAIRRRRPPAPESLPSSCMGYQNSCNIDPAGLGCRWLVSRHGHDQEQQEEGSQGKSCCGEEVEMKSLPVHINEIFVTGAKGTLRRTSRSAEGSRRCTPCSGTTLRPR